MSRYSCPEAKEATSAVACLDAYLRRAVTDLSSLCFDGPVGSGDVPVLARRAIDEGTEDELRNTVALPQPFDRNQGRRVQYACLKQYLGCR